MSPNNRIATRAPLGEIKPSSKAIAIAIAIAMTNVAVSSAELEERHINDENAAPVSKKKLKKLKKAAYKAGSKSPNESTTALASGNSDSTIIVPVGALSKVTKFKDFKKQAKVLPGAPIIASGKALNCGRKAKTHKPVKKATRDGKRNNPVANLRNKYMYLLTVEKIEQRILDQQPIVQQEEHDGPKDVNDDTSDDTPPYLVDASPADDERYIVDEGDFLQPHDKEEDDEDIEMPDAWTDPADNVDYQNDVGTPSERDEPVSERDGEPAQEALFEHVDNDAPAEQAATLEGDVGNVGDFADAIEREHVDEIVLFQEVVPMDQKASEDVTDTDLIVDTVAYEHPSIEEPALDQPDDAAISEYSLHEETITADHVPVQNDDATSNDNVIARDILITDETSSEQPRKDTPELADETTTSEFVVAGEPLSPADPDASEYAADAIIEEHDLADEATPEHGGDLASEHADDLPPSDVAIYEEPSPSDDVPSEHGHGIESKSINNSMSNNNDNTMSTHQTSLGDSLLISKSDGVYTSAFKYETIMIPLGTLKNVAKLTVAAKKKPWQLPQDKHIVVAKHSKHKKANTRRPVQKVVRDNNHGTTALKFRTKFEQRKASKKSVDPLDQYRDLFDVDLLQEGTLSELSYDEFDAPIPSVADFDDAPPQFAHGDNYVDMVGADSELVSSADSMHSLVAPDTESPAAPNADQIENVALIEEEEVASATGSNIEDLPAGDTNDAVSEQDEAAPVGDSEQEASVQPGDNTVGDDSSDSESSGTAEQIEADVTPSVEGSEALESGKADTPATPFGLLGLPNRAQYLSRISRSKTEELVAVHVTSLKPWITAPPAPKGILKDKDTPVYPHRTRENTSTQGERPKPIIALVPDTPATPAGLLSLKNQVQYPSKLSPKKVEQLIVLHVTPLKDEKKNQRGPKNGQPTKTDPKKDLTKEGERETETKVDTNTTFTPPNFLGAIQDFKKPADAWVSTQKRNFDLQLAKTDVVAAPQPQLLTINRVPST